MIVNHYLNYLNMEWLKVELRPSETTYHKISHTILSLLQTNKLLTFYSFDKIRKKLREPKVDFDWLTLW